MDIRKMREELAEGKSVYDLPLRVTFYARVSTERDEQINSLENQVQYYTDLITHVPNWQLYPGYIDEGISGGSTRKRESFLQMIEDAKAGRFDFIITKEISRFSRSTLDSIKYTQELLHNNVAVMFQNDNINTLDMDSEFRLVVMAGVAQDELRKMSERTKFGFRQSIRNGHILGCDNLWGYHKKDCQLTINTHEATAIRLIFDLYANKGYGTRKISKILTEMGYSSRMGNKFNTVTIRNIIMNPKYKGWYCGRKSKNVNYLTKEKVLLDESEWVTYPDPRIPAIVTEEIWNRANSLYKSRRKQMMEHAEGASYHNTYSYSGKIYCGEHGAICHRRIDHLKNEDRELWQCKVYRTEGAAACTAPPVSKEELNSAISPIFDGYIDKERIIQKTIHILRETLQSDVHTPSIAEIEKGLARLRTRKNHLLDLRLDEMISKKEFSEKNEVLNRRIQRLENKRGGSSATQEAEDARLNLLCCAVRKAVASEAISQSDLIGKIVKKVVILQGSSKSEKHLSIELYDGSVHNVVITQGSVLRRNPNGWKSKNSD